MSAVKGLPIEEIEKEVRRVISDQLGIPLEKVLPKSTLKDGLGADSLDVVEFVMALEDQFEIEILDDDAEVFTTVQSVINYIQKRSG